MNYLLGYILIVVVAATGIIAGEAIAAERQRRREWAEMDARHAASPRIKTAQKKGGEWWAHIQYTLRQEEERRAG